MQITDYILRNSITYICDYHAVNEKRKTNAPDT